MHVIGPPPIPAESIGLLGLLLLGLGWKCRRGRVRRIWPQDCTEASAFRSIPVGA